MALRDKTSASVAVSVVCLLCVLLFFQGGFYPEVSAVFAMGYAAILVVISAGWLWGRKPWRSEKRGSAADGMLPGWTRGSYKRLVVPAAFLLIALLYAVSVVAHRLSSASLLECFPWILAAVVALACASLGPVQRAWLLGAIAWIGVVSAWIGVAISAGLGQTEGTFHAARLQFFFEYANAAGAWFACTTLLCMSIDDARLRRCSMSPLVALLLTQSMGSILLLAVVAIVYMACSKASANRSTDPRCKTEWTSVVVCIFIQGILAALTFVAFRSGVEFSDGVGALLFVLLQCAFYKLWPYMCKWFKESGRQVRLSRALHACAILVCVCAAMLFLAVIGSRLTQASATFVERVVQAKDALALLAESPLLGVGPDQWQYVYPEHQSTEYKSTLVHCGYLQLGLDAGILAPLMLLSVIICAVVSGIRARSECPWPALVFLLAHSFVDFDLQFAFYPVLVVVLASISLADRSQTP